MLLLGHLSFTLNHTKENDMAKCKNCNNLYNLSDENDVIVGKWCPKINDSPDLEMERDCEHFKCLTNADRIRQMTDEELAKFFVAELPSCKDCSEPETELGFCSKKCDSLYLRWLQSEVKPE